VKSPSPSVPGSFSMMYSSFDVLGLASVVPVSGALAVFEPAVDASSPPVSLSPLAPIDPELGPSPEPPPEHEAELQLALVEPALARVVPLAICASVPLAPVMLVTPVGCVEPEQAGAASAARARPQDAMIGRTSPREKLARDHLRVAFGIASARNTRIVHVTLRRRLVCPRSGNVQHCCCDYRRARLRGATRDACALPRDALDGAGAGMERGTREPYEQLEQLMRGATRAHRVGLLEAPASSSRRDTARWKFDRCRRMAPCLMAEVDVSSGDEDAPRGSTSSRGRGGLRPWGCFFAPSASTVPAMLHDTPVILSFCGPTGMIGPSSNGTAWPRPRRDFAVLRRAGFLR
jgi:hypothetical protein